MQTAVVVLTLCLVAALVVPLVGRQRHRRGFSTVDERITFRTLHTAGLAASALRDGLSEAAAARAARQLRELLGAPAVGVTGPDGLLAWEGPGDHHAVGLLSTAQAVAQSGRPAVARGADPALSPCHDPSCPVRGAVVVPLASDGRVVGTLIAASSTEPGGGYLRAVTETARFVSDQLELAELDRSRAALAQAEVRALRAQISPHFIYNALGAIASFVRTDPVRARELLLEFAEFTRYSFRSQGEFTTLAEELHNIERYLTLELARFGDRLQARLQVAPEVLPVAVPFLAVQPLVENAVRHGLAGKTGIGTVTIVARDAGHECHLSVEDDGVGMDPQELLASLAKPEHVGLGNVDDRLRSAFGDDYGLVVETAPGAGTKVSMRLPKFAAGVRAS